MAYRWGVVVTGGVSGLGLATAKAFATKGARLVVTDIVDAKADAALAEIKAAGGEGLYVRSDVSSWADAEALRDAVLGRWGGIDVLVNNAGIADSGSLEKTRPDDWARMIDIDLMGVVRNTRAFVDTFRSQKSGHIVNVASFAGIAQAPGMIAYNTAKAGVIGFSESLRAELYPVGVGVSVVCPSFFKTELTRSMTGSSPGSVAFVEKLMEKSAITAEDVARDILSAVEAKKFMVLPHKATHSRMLMKRLLPEVYFKELVKAAWGKDRPALPQ